MDKQQKVRVLRAIPGCVEAFAKGGFEDDEPLESVSLNYQVKDGDNLFKTRPRPNFLMDELAGEGLVEVKITYVLQMQYQDAGTFTKKKIYSGSYEKNRELISAFYYDVYLEYLKSLTLYYSGIHHLPMEHVWRTLINDGILSIRNDFSYRRTEAAEQWLERDNLSTKSKDTPISSNVSESHVVEKRSVVKQRRKKLKDTEIDHAQNRVRANFSAKNG